VPDDLFFGDEQEVDLNDIYGTGGKRYTVRGLINILDSYKFTVDENTPIEEEIALDPELLGKVFENLLAAYNPETGVTARKQTGSFYTPREIVNYMVDESLVAYLESQFQIKEQTEEQVEERQSSTLTKQIREQVERQSSTLTLTKQALLLQLQACATCWPITTNPINSAPPKLLG
jgi:hypothetical protein